MKRWIKLTALAAALLLVVLIATPLFIDTNTFRPLLESQLTTALNRKVTLGDLSLSLFTGSLSAKTLTIADDPAFSSTPFLQAKSLRIGVELRPLLFDHKVLIRNLTIDAPQVHLVHADPGPNRPAQWNFSTIGRNALPRPGQPPTQTDILVDQLSITNGHATVESLPSDTATVNNANVPARVYDAIHLEATNLALKRQFPLTLTANLPGEARLSLTGKAGPINPRDAARTAFDAQLKLDHLDPVAAGFLNASAGISLLADLDAHTFSNGQTITSTGTVHAHNLKLRPTAAPAPKPIDITYNVVHNLATDTGQVQDAGIQAGRVAAHITGTYAVTPTTTQLKLRLNAPGLPIDDLQALLPAAGVKLPNGSGLRGGTLTTNLTIAGPVTALAVAGPIELSNTRLNGFNLGSQLKGIASLATGQTGNLTNIQTLSFNLDYARETVQASNIYAALPALGTATGNGTVAPSGALDFRLIMKLDTTRGLGGTALGILSALTSAGGSLTSRAASNGVPVTITGTASSPVITPDVGGLLKNNAGSILGGKGNSGAQGIVDSLGSLFGKQH